MIESLLLFMVLLTVDFEDDSVLDTDTDPSLYILLGILSVYSMDILDGAVVDFIVFSF